MEQSVSFRIDPGKDDVLYYLEGEDWNSLTQEDIDQVSAGDYRVKLDFSDTEPEIAVVDVYKRQSLNTFRGHLSYIEQTKKMMNFFMQTMSSFT